MQPSSSGTRTHSSTPTTIALRSPKLLSSNPWLSFDVAPPSEETCNVFDLKHGLDAASPSNWALTSTEHGLERLIQTSVKAVKFETSLFAISAGESFGTSLSKRLSTFIDQNQLEVACNGLLGYTIHQAASYIDSWSRACHEHPNLFKYKQFGLVPSPLGFAFDSRITERKQLIRVLCSAIFIDRILSSLLFYADPLESFALVEHLTKSYIESAEDLIPHSHWVYETTQPFPAGTIGRACQQSLKWRTYFDELPKPSPKGQSDPGFQDFGKVPNKLLKDMLKADERAADGIAQGNISRCAFSLLTTWGQTTVCNAIIISRLYLTCFPKGDGSYTGNDFTNFEQIRPIEAYKTIAAPKKPKKALTRALKSASDTPEPSNALDVPAVTASKSFSTEYVEF